MEKSKLRAVLVAFATVLLYVVIEHSRTIIDHSVQRQEGSVPDEWSLNWCGSIPFWVARNSLTTRTRAILLYMEAEHFSEKELTSIFSQLTHEFAEPELLSIEAFSDRNAVRDALRNSATEVYFNDKVRENSDGFAATSTDLPRGFLIALYHRGDGEGFFYTFDATKPEVSYVTLKVKAD